MSSVYFRVKKESKNKYWDTFLEEVLSNLIFIFFMR